jgi:type I protein arginine methyltransferase
MTDATGYDIASYGDMMVSEPRMSSYVDALRAAVTPGCRVIDLGCGPGIFAFLALQFGAGHVDAIEPDPSILLARDLARRNGMADRITFFQGLSTDFTPAAPADVLLSDIRGNMPLFQHHIPIIADARKRLLRPGGVQIPQVDTIRVALLSDPDLTKRLHGPWDDRFGLDLTPAIRFGTSSMRRMAITADRLMSDPADIITIDYTTVIDPNARGQAALVATRASRIDGLAIWFDARLDAVNGYSNAPGEPDLVYGHSALPLAQPVDLAAGDRLHVDLRATYVDHSYEWTWVTAIQPADQPDRRALFTQSSLQSRVIDPVALSRRADGHVPRAGATLAVDRYILNLVDGTRSQGQMAAALRDQFPDLGLTADAALRRVVQVVGRSTPTTERAFA